MKSINRLLTTLFLALVGVLLVKALFTVIGGALFTTDILSGSVQRFEFSLWSSAAAVSEAAVIGWVVGRREGRSFGFLAPIGTYLGMRFIEIAALRSFSISAEHSWFIEAISLATCLLAWFVRSRSSTSGSRG